jgi:hypothetical protein
MGQAIEVAHHPAAYLPHRHIEPFAELIRRPDEVFPELSLVRRDWRTSCSSLVRGSRPEPAIVIPFTAQASAPYAITAY